MFSQVSIPEHQHDLNRFVFRPPGEKKFKTFCHLRWWFGNTASPTAAQLAVIETGERNKEEFPLGYINVKEKRYMDDTINSAKSVKEAVTAVQQTVKIFDIARMSVQKLISNSPEVMMSVAKECRLKEYLSGILSKTKILGYEYDPNCDVMGLPSVKDDLK